MGEFRQHDFAPRRALVGLLGITHRFGELVSLRGVLRRIHQTHRIALIQVRSGDVVLNEVRQGGIHREQPLAYDLPRVVLVSTRRVIAVRPFRKVLPDAGCLILAHEHLLPGVFPIARGVEHIRQLLGILRRKHPVHLMRQLVQHRVVVRIDAPLHVFHARHGRVAAAAAYVVPQPGIVVDPLIFQRR